jgi:hypothetical protein
MLRPVVVLPDRVTSYYEGLLAQSFQELLLAMLAKSSTTVAEHFTEQVVAASS